MNVDNKNSLDNVQKRIYNVKPIKSDGLVLQVNHIVLSNQKQSLRFVIVSFNKYSNLVVAGDHGGNVFILDIVQNKFWRLPSIYLCTVIKFSTYGSGNDVVIGTTSGEIHLVDVLTGTDKGQLVGHSQAVRNVFFTLDRICLTVSEREAILWDLQNNVKVQVLCVQHESSLKFAVFMPITNNILACFDDNTITVWKYGSYEVIKQILPNSNNKQSLKDVAFTRNGRAMVLSGHSSRLVVYMLDTWTIFKVITLPESILSVKKIEFLPHLFDGGSNRILAILSGNGVIYFYDMGEMTITSQISTDEEIAKFDCSPDGKHISCILRSGEINIYRLTQHIPTYNKIETVKESNQKTKTTLFPNRGPIVTAVRKQIKEVLNHDKLHSILKEFGEYPDSYRLTIWTQLLELPNNHHQYNHFMNHATQPTFDNILIDYPLENKTALKNLRKLLQNLVTWSPFFSQVPYLPVFVFPFVKVFQNEPVLCFEAACTIIINWCQYWFEYFPLPPLNVLAIVENIVLEHNPDLINHFTYNKVTTKDYAWPLLESAFSEVLTTKEWCVLWDHILTNEPGFLIMSVAAYNIIHSEALLAMNKLGNINIFFHSQNVIDIKKLVNKTYFLLNNTSLNNHPRRYLNDFKKLEVGSYLSFLGFPKFLFDLEFNEVGSLQQEKKQIQVDESELMKEKDMVEKYLEIDIVQETQDERIAELEKLCHLKIKEERQQVADQRKRLVDLRQQLHQKEIDVLIKSREKMAEKNSKQMQRSLEKILNDVDQSRAIQEIEVAKTESELIKHYSELLLHKLRTEEMTFNEQVLSDTYSEHQLLKKQQQKLVEELEMIRQDSNSKNYLKHLNVVTSMAAMDDLLLRIEEELIQNKEEQDNPTRKPVADNKILKLKAETKELEMQVSSLLMTLGKLKEKEAKTGIPELRSKVYNKKQTAGNYKLHIPLQQDFRKLKSIIQESRSYILSKDSISEEVASLSYD